jgi:hypothetical protein
MLLYSTLNLLVAFSFCSFQTLILHLQNNTAFVAVDFKELWLGIGGHHNYNILQLEIFLAAV